MDSPGGHQWRLVGSSVDHGRSWLWSMVHAGALTHWQPLWHSSQATESQSPWCATASATDLTHHVSILCRKGARLWQPLPLSSDGNGKEQQRLEDNCVRTPDWFGPYNVSRFRCEHTYFWITCLSLNTFNLLPDSSTRPASYAISLCRCLQWKKRELQG